MSRPLLISDCDEVLLHMVAHFQAWLAEAHDVHFAFETGQFADALTHVPTGETLPEARVWELLTRFFREEMERQTPAPGALEALRRIGQVADIVILTNLGHDAHPLRVAQLASHGVHYEVVCNQGGKGIPARAIIERHQPSVTVFVDDLHMHHQSVAKHAPEVWRLHMIAEPKVAVHMPPAPHAHARIDTWAEAVGWIRARFAEGPAG